MDEDFELGFDFAANGADLVKGEFTGKDDAGEAEAVEEADAFEVVVVHLGAGMEAYGGKVEAEDAHVLDDESIDAYTGEFTDEAFGFRKFVVVEYGVEGDEYAAVVTVGVFDETGDVGDAVGSSTAGTEGRRTDVDGVGAVVNGGNGNGEVSGRGKELYGFHGVGVRGCQGWRFPMRCYG